MAWRDEMQQGSWRGVEFYTRAADGQFGRRVALHQYPGRDLPYAEDLGRQARRFSLELFVLGGDYMSQRDRLRAAIEQPGPGLLVHPWLGQLRLVVLEARGPRESTRDGGRASFSVTFVEAGEQREPAAQIDTSTRLDKQADLTAELLAEVFGAAFDVTGPEFIETAARSRLQRAADDLAALARQLGAPGSTLVEWLGDLSAYSSELTTLVRTPGDLALRTLGAVQDLANIALRPLDAFDVYRQLFDWGDDADPVPQATAARRQQAANQAATGALVRGAAITAAVRQAADHNYTSVDQAIAMRDQLLDQLERESLAAGDSLYQQLLDLRVALLTDIDARGADLPRIVRYTPPSTLPALVLAHHLYGDSTRADELVARNNVRHPGFVPGGDPLEVLSDA